MDLQELFNLQTKLNNETFLKNDCYLYQVNSPRLEILTGTFEQLVTHIKTKPTSIVRVRIPQFNSGAWLDIDGPESWGIVQDWWLNSYNLAQRQETSEFTDTTNWKWWRSKVNKKDANHARVEAIDELHFWMSKCILLGLNAEDIDRIYKKKNEVNLNRQEEGYLTKKDDEKEIK